MLHLAQVEEQPDSGKRGLRLLARQVAEHAWEVLPNDAGRSGENFLLAEAATSLNHGNLVLVQVSEDRQITETRPATDWVMEFVETYLIYGVTPDFLKQESERVEGWRQELTLKSQELTRRTMETEARRDRIQTLEQDLEAQKHQLDEMMQSIIEREKKLENAPSVEENSVSDAPNEASPSDENEAS